MMRALRLLRSILAFRIPTSLEPNAGFIVFACLATALGVTILIDRASQPVRPGEAPPLVLTPVLPVQWPAGVKLGTAAPDFVLPRVDGGGDVHLRSLIGRKPVVLVFGSFSCDVFQSRLNEVVRLYEGHKDRAEFLFVNVREGGHRLPQLEFLVPACNTGPGLDGEELPWEEHRQAVRKALGITKLPMTAVIDRHDHKVMSDYGAFPSRLVVIDNAGKVVLDLGRIIERRWDLYPVETWLKAHTTRQSRA